MENLNEHQKLNWVAFAIQEAINGNPSELTEALRLVEDLRDTHTYEDEEDIIPVRAVETFERR